MSRRRRGQADHARCPPIARRHGLRRRRPICTCGRSGPACCPHSVAEPTSRRVGWKRKNHDHRQPDRRRIRGAGGHVAATATGEVNRRDWQRWAASVGDHNPLWFDADYARANGYDDVICPPLYLQYCVLPVTSLQGLRPDGSSGAVSGSLAFPRAPKRMAGGESTTFHLPALSPRRDRDGAHHRLDRRKAGQIRTISFWSPGAPATATSAAIWSPKRRRR